MTRTHRLRSPRSFATAAAALLTSVVLAACGSGSSGSASSPSEGGSDSAGGGTLNIAFPTDIPQFDPVVVGPTQRTQILSLIYEPLFTLDEAGDVQPGLATEYSFNDEGTQLIVTLRDGLTFQDGSPLDADAVAFHYNRGLTQENSALKSAYQDIASVTAVDATHVQFDLKSPNFGFPLILTNRSSLIVSKQAAEGDLDALSATSPVGAGPFKVVQIVPGASVTLEKWDGYWDADNIFIDTVKVTFPADSATVLSGLQTGAFNFVTSLPPQDVDAAEASGFKVQADTSTNWTVNFVSINKQQAPFTNPKVVEAFNTAVNRQAFADTLGFGLGEATANVVPSTNPAWSADAEKVWTYDPDKAKELLSESGETDLHLTVKIFPGSTAAAELLQQQLQAVGFTVDLVEEDTATFLEKYRGKEDQVAVYGYVGRDNKLLALDEHFSAKGILNLSATEDPAYTAAREKVLQTPLDDPNYKTLLQEASKVGVETGGTVVLYARANPSATAADVSDFPKIDGLFRWNGIKVG